MKQGEAARPNLDLDDLERQLSAAAAPRRNGGDDPLAELARIVGYNDRPVGRPAPKAGGSFDDFLVNPPRSVSEMMGAQSARSPAAPTVAALSEPPALAAEPPAAPRPPEAPSYEAPIQSAPASLQDQLAAALGEFEPRLRPTLPMEETVRPEPPAQVAPAAPAYHAPEPAAAAEGPSSQAAIPEPTHSDPRFEEMLKEFDAAMRDVGAKPLQPPPIAAEPPEQRQPPTVSPTLAYDPDAEPVVPAMPVQAGRSRFGMALAGGVIGVALIGAAGLLAFGGSSKNATGGAAPVIAAKPGVTKERPANPGGVEVPNQDKEILSRAPSAPQAERVAPREEQPVDLTQAQRSAEPQPSIRQIPGVLVVGPSSTTPPSGASSAGAPAVNTPPAAQPRPVASVPITISGQPPADPPAAPAPTVAPTQPSMPTMTRPVAALPSQPAAPVAAAPSPAAPPVVAAPAQPQGAAANGQNASSEPRRVRAVPIRPDEGAPNRAQAQPRVVPAQPTRQTAAQPAAPAAPEADDGNAPLRITPQGARPAANPRPVALAPAGVPASTSAPATTQSTSADAAPSSGGGSFAVQIAAEGSQDAAQAKFNRMRAQHSGVLGSVSPTIRSAEVNGRAVYRVRVGQMSREEAVGLCERLKADGGSCFVARN